MADSRSSVLDTLDIEARVDKFAKINGFVFHDTKAKVLEGLKQRKSRYGDHYCPCRVVHQNADNSKIVCPCVYAKEEVERDGHCHCNLFFKK
jgi:ferredoxin-thioredoxin reductase catalytic subunit